jgi:DNA-binding NarL/FixJ family response regulator
MNKQAVFAAVAVCLLSVAFAQNSTEPANHGIVVAYMDRSVKPGDDTDPELAAEAFHRGASGYLLKTCAASELVLAVRDVLRGKTYLSSTLKEKVNYLRWEQKEIVEEANRLTERQREVLQLLAEGKVMKEVAGILNMTTRTVAFHKYRIMGALGAKSNAELVRYAVRNHIVAA